MRRWVVPASVLLLSTVLTGQQPGLTSAQIEKPATTSWPTFNGDYSGRRSSTLSQINAANVKHLSVAYDASGNVIASRTVPRTAGFGVANAYQAARSVQAQIVLVLMA